MESRQVTIRSVRAPRFSGHRPKYGRVLVHLVESPNYELSLKWRALSQVVATGTLQQADSNRHAATGTNSHAATGRHQQARCNRHQQARCNRQAPTGTLQQAPTGTLQQAHSNRHQQARCNRHTATGTNRHAATGTHQQAHCNRPQQPRCNRHKYNLNFFRTSKVLENVMPIFKNPYEPII